MPTKPLHQLSPAYRRRIERQLAAGKTRQEARGHKQSEHVERRRREIIREQSGWYGQPAPLRRSTKFARAWLNLFDPAMNGGTKADVNNVIDPYLDYARDSGSAEDWASFRELYDTLILGG